VDPSVRLASGAYIITIVNGSHLVRDATHFVQDADVRTMLRQGNTISRLSIL
jgi:hypothetical protein